MVKPRTLTLTEASQALTGGQLTAEALTTDVLDACGAHNERLGAYVLVDSEGALSAAQESDVRRSAGRARTSHEIRTPMAAGPVRG